MAEQSGSNPFLLPQNIAPGGVFQYHLVVVPTQKGDLYYGNDGIRFTQLKIGTTGQQLMVIGGVPAWASFPQTGTGANRPTSGRFTGDQYYATDTKVFSVWDGAAWRTTTLT